VKRENGEIELTAEEIQWLWQEAHDAPFPDGLGLRFAAEAVLLTFGASKIEELLSGHSRPREFDPSD